MERTQVDWFARLVFMEKGIAPKASGQLTLLIQSTAMMVGKHGKRVSHFLKMEPEKRR
jgi:hypothetical protein